MSLIGPRPYLPREKKDMGCIQFIINVKTRAWRNVKQQNVEVMLINHLL